VTKAATTLHISARGQTLTWIPNRAGNPQIPHSRSTTGRFESQRRFGDPVVIYNMPSNTAEASLRAEHNTLKKDPGQVESPNPINVTL
jgi:hypothetical protein